MNSSSPAPQFGAKAAQYSKEAKTQLAVAQHLADLLIHSKHPLKGEWLDIGSGPAIMADFLYAKAPKISPTLLDISQETLNEGVIRFPNCKTICCNMDSLPKFSRKFDGVVASSSLQWSTDLPQLFSELRKTVAQTGVGAFALFTEKTLQQLRKTQREFQIDSPVTFPSHQSIISALSNAGFKA